MIAKAESLEEFYQHKFNYLPVNVQSNIGHFNVFRLEDCMFPDAQPVQYNRREFFKIAITNDINRYHYADKSLAIDQPSLMFFNPQVPYSWEPLSAEQSGYFCIFSTSFFTETIKGSISELPMYRIGGNPCYPLNADQQERVNSIFIKMMEEMQSEYAFKYDLLRNYVTELTHLALKSNPAENLYQHPDAKARITVVFTELLERQFPIETPLHRFTMRSPRDFASQLAVHVNYLNRAIKETTGKTTSDLIQERLLSEAKILLKHTSWNVSEIGYSLGFEEPSHFNNFFKKHTLVAPTAFRTA